MSTIATPSVELKRIGLGTVQFGMDYGVSNASGQTPKEEVARILSEAESMGICTLDTAAGYGNSEMILGEILPPGHLFNIITKTAQFNKTPITAEDGKALVESFRSSLQRLRQQRVYGLLAHNADDLLADTSRHLWRSMSALKGDDLVSKIGASVYTAEQIDGLLERYNLDIIQVPLNVFDQRLIKSGHLKKLKARRIEIHVRSVFLQGLLLMNPEDIPPALAAAVPRIREWREALAIEGISPVTAALEFVLSRSEVDRAVVGICDTEQLRALDHIGLARQSRIPWSRYAIDEEKILNPAVWPKDR